MEEEIKFLHYKKLLIFGSEGVGKTTLTDVLEDNTFKAEKPSKQSKLYN